MALEETRIVKQLKNVKSNEELEEKRKELAELEDKVKRKYLSEHPNVPVEELFGIISDTIPYNDGEYHIITTFSKSDYERITSDSEAKSSQP